jgi:Zn-dependent oligopeptidase
VIHEPLIQILCSVRPRTRPESDTDIVAQDFFGEFEKHGIFNPKIGKKFRREILAVGGSYEEKKLVKNFLGRRVSSKPFLKHLGLKK